MFGASPNSQTNEYVTADIENRNIHRFMQVFSITASFQGRLAYFLMSFHAVNPGILKSVTSFEPKKYLFANMVYGIGMMIYRRHFMKDIRTSNRIAFSVLGSLMFNHSSMLFYGWLVDNFSHRPYLLTLLGFLAGRIMMVHLLAFLYHVDTRYRAVEMRPGMPFESMYNRYESD